jgi:hypothetical protein
MTNPNLDPTQAALDHRLVQLVDTITVGSVPRLSDASLAEFRLRYGETFHEEIETYADTQLATFGDHYCSDLNAFVCAGQLDEDHEDVTIPLPPYLTEKESPTHLPVIDFRRHQNELEAWLGFGHQRKSEQVDTTLLQIVMTLQQFHGPSTQRAINNLDDEALRVLAHKRLDSQAGLVMNEAVRQIRLYSSSPVVARSLMNTPFAKQYQSFGDELRLRTHLAALEGHQKTSGDYTEDYQWVLTNIKQALSNPDLKNVSEAASESLSDITRKVPAEIMDLIEDSNGEVIKAVQRIASTEILQMAPEDLTEAHLKLLSQIESDITHSAVSYADILYLYKNRDGQVPNYKLENLAKLYVDNKHRYMEYIHQRGATTAAYPRSLPSHDINVAAFVCANISIEELESTLQNYPDLIQDESRSARDIAVYRLALADQTKAAYELANEQIGDPKDVYSQMARLRCLSIVYEITGNLDAQEQLRNEARQMNLPASFQQELTARRLAGAYKNNQYNTYQTAYSDLVSDFNYLQPHTRQAVLKLTCQTLLDIGDLQAAEDCALKLIKENTTGQHFELRRDADRAFLAVTQAYVRANQHESAIRLIFNYLAAGRPLNEFAMQAMELTLEPDVVHHISFNAGRLDPLLREEGRIASISESEKRR